MPQWQSGDINHMGYKSPQDPHPLFTCMTLFPVNNKPTVSLNANTAHSPSPPHSICQLDIIFECVAGSFSACVCVSLFPRHPHVLYFCPHQLNLVQTVSSGCCDFWKFGGASVETFISVSFPAVRWSLNKSAQRLTFLYTCLCVGKHHEPALSCLGSTG